MSVLRDERFCAHDGDIVITTGDVPRCGDCGTEMLWVPKYVLDAYTKVITDQSEIIVALRAEQ